MFITVEVKTFRQVLVLRGIRNECRKWMTHHSGKIGVWEQFWWWLLQYSPRREAGRLYCYLFYMGDQAIGYGLASIKSDEVWISGGIRKKYRGGGFGKEIFGWLIKTWGHQRMFLDVFEDNVAAITIYKRLGFRKIGRRYREKVIIMRRSRMRKKI